MCGILGAWSAFAAASVPSATALLAHRGPDDTGQYRDPNLPLCLGHVRLAILDTSSCGHQPMASGDGSVVLVFNGEIYNFPELRSSLVDEGYPFKGKSDTEVVLAMYLRDGDAMLEKLNGIFALAIWNAREQELFLARDAMGVKPLYIAEERRGFAFGSELKAVICLLEDPSLVDPAALHRYMSFLWCPGEGTPLKNIRKLLPGEALIVRNGQVKRRWRWHEPAAFRARSYSIISSDSAIKGTITALRTAVHRQLISDVPVGAFLSGGLDSSAIVALARERVPDIMCFTIESTGGDEAGVAPDLPYARKVARHLGVPLEVVSIDSSRMASDLEEMVYQLDEPLADPAALNVLYISRLARSKGIKVLLSGAGGDDLFTGYRRHLALTTEHLWSWMPMRVRRQLGGAVSRMDQRNTLRRRITKLFSGAALEGDERLANYFLWSSEDQLRGLYTRDFDKAVTSARAVDPMLEFLGGIPASAPRLERLLALEQRFFLADHNLTYTDKMSMAAGVEVRVPFLDVDLVEFAAGLPPRVKQRGRQGKWVLKKAMEPYLPADVIYRPKSGFGAPLRRWMRFELRELLGDVLSPESLRSRGFFRPEAVHSLIAANDSGKADASYTLLSLLCIELWCRRFIDRKERLCA